MYLYVSLVSIKKIFIIKKLKIYLKRKEHQTELLIVDIKMTWYINLHCLRVDYIYIY